MNERAPEGSTTTRADQGENVRRSVEITDDAESWHWRLSKKSGRDRDGFNESAEMKQKAATRRAPLPRQQDCKSGVGHDGRGRSRRHPA
jgi:hypothetical protein